MPVHHVRRASEGESNLMVRSVIRALDPTVCRRWRPRRRGTPQSADHRCATVPAQDLRGLIHAEAAVRPGPHVLDHFRLDLVLGQVQSKGGFLPSRLQAVPVQFGYFQELALRSDLATADQRANVRAAVSPGDPR